MIGEQIEVYPLEIKKINQKQIASLIKLVLFIDWVAIRNEPVETWENKTE